MQWIRISSGNSSSLIYNCKAEGRLTPPLSYRGLFAAPLPLWRVSCPKNTLLNLPPQGYHAVGLCAAGYRAAEDTYATLPKVRYPLEIIVEVR